MADGHAGRLRFGDLNLNLDLYVHLTTDLYHAIDWETTEVADGLVATTSTFDSGGGTVRDRGRLSVRIWPDGDDLPGRQV